MESPPRVERPPAAAPIDPRIRARRIEVARRAGRRRLQRLADVGVVLLVVAAFVGALWTPLLDVDEVTVTGATHSGVAVVAERAGIRAGDPLIRVDLRGAGERVAALPWIAEVHVARGLDGRVALDVTERTPVATIGSGVAALLVDLEGRVLGPVTEAPDAGPLVALTGLTPAPVGAYVDDAADGLAIAAQVAVAAPGTIASIDATQLTATLAQGGEVRFGDARQLDAKLRSLRTMLDQVDLTCLELLDLRLPGSPVLTREGGCS